MSFQTFPVGTPKYPQEVLAKYKDILRKGDNVVALGIGRMMVNGEKVDCISVHVKHIDNVPKDFPTQLDGVPIKLVDTGGGIVPA